MTKDQDFGNQGLKGYKCMTLLLLVLLVHFVKLANLVPLPVSQFRQVIRDSLGNVRSLLRSLVTSRMDVWHSSRQNDQKCSQKLREKKQRTIFKVGPSYVIHNNIQLNYVGVYSVHMKDQETFMLEPAGRNTKVRIL